MKYYVVDIEADELLDKVTKIHCLSYQGVGNSERGSFIKYEDIIQFLNQKDIILVGHNFVRYDKPVLEKILKQKFIFKVIDTLALSWTLFPKRKKGTHGLEDWGEFFGVKKPIITDWSSLTKEEYIHRCEEDVKINTKLWNKCYDLLKQLYDSEDFLYRYCYYLSFKMDCVREQEEIGLKLDVNHINQMIEKLTLEKETKINKLAEIMPKDPILKKKVYKDAIKDKNGNIYTKGDLFYNFIPITEAPKDIIVSTIKGYNPGNPSSTIQIKNWLYSLGWVPENIQHKRDKKKNTVKKIPQISSKLVKGEVCESVKKLFIKEPNLELLNGLSIISHRLSIFEGFIKDVKEDRIYPSCGGLTNTLRLQHRVIQNLPGFDKQLGKEVRSSLIADEDSILCGSDLSGIEDNTKRHYIYKYDPKYVEEMNVPGYDPHLEIAVLAGFLTKEQAEDHKLFEKTKGKEGVSYKAIRQKAKTTNFSATYKVAYKTLAINANISEKEAKKLLKIYWQRNKAILQIEDDLEVKEIQGQKWILNPVSKFWYTLRADKDKFSTLNQGSAVFIYDSWLKYLRKYGLKIGYQCHDEFLANVKVEDKEKIELLIKNCMDRVNEELKLNVTIGCSISWGENYYLCH